MNIKLFDDFIDRHIGPSDEEIQEMLKAIGVNSIEEMIDKTIPSHIRLQEDLELPERISEYEFTKEIDRIAAKNKVFRSYIGMGYYNTVTPGVIQRNIFENPGWYTQYTPYQAEISQGRLEALFNFQTMVADLTGFDLANASLLDEATAAGEAMAMLFSKVNRNPKKPKRTKFFVSDKVLPQTKDVLQSRALYQPIELVFGDHEETELTEDYFGALLQYPAEDGAIYDYKQFIADAKDKGIFIAMAADIMSLALLTPPGELGADVAVGSTQRFGVPLGFGGPHAAYFACNNAFKRLIPGRIIGLSVDSQENPAYRMALQTREQHIRREKATSNICTAQALLAIMAGMYAVYHGPEGIKNIALRIHYHTAKLAEKLEQIGYEQINQYFFDTLRIKANDVTANIRSIAEAKEINFRYFDNGDIGISLDETIKEDDFNDIASIFSEAKNTGQPSFSAEDEVNDFEMNWPEPLVRTSPYMEHAVFNSFRSETELMRYIKRLENRDISLDISMIPLGSCTMKLNSVAELQPVSKPEFNAIHPFVPREQVDGYHELLQHMDEMLIELTGFTACSMQPNSGAQGELTGLLVIKAYHEDHGNHDRTVALIPSSAHGTNPASAIMAGMDVVVVKCDDHGNIDVADLKEKAEKYKDKLAGLMVTYPSTHGVFEESITEVCEIIHNNGGLVYMDGANMNAQVGYTTPAAIGADVCHLNLHKTFSIPHGGGGPGMGPICCNDKLKPYLPGHSLVKTGGEKAIPAVAATPFGSPSIVVISYAYMRLLGWEGAKKSTAVAILNANYLKAKLNDHYPALYSGKNGLVAHEFIMDVRQFKHDLGIELDDIAKRLVDYGFHAPTVSFPVPGTLMVEPTESESKRELDKFIEAMIGIRKEIGEVADGTMDAEDNALKNAPHTAEVAMSSDWDHPYAREKAVFPVEYLKVAKFWPSVGRVDNAYGDRNLICTCPPMEEYEEEPTAIM